MKEIEEHFAKCESNDSAKNLYSVLNDCIEEHYEEFRSQHCSETGMSIHECDCFDCRDERDILKAEARYDAMKVGEY